MLSQVQTGFRNYGEPFELSRAQWFALPLVLRQRWRRETDYSAKPPSSDLKEAIRAALQETIRAG